MLPVLSLSHLFATLLNLAAETNRQADLAPLEGRSFAVAIDELPQDIAISVEGGKISALDENTDGEADVTISGNIKAILNMIKNEESGLDSDELYIAGKISTAKHFQHFLASLSVDWQGFFDKFLPEELAGKAADALEQGLHFAKGSGEKLAESLRVYLIDKKQLLVSQSAFDDFKQQLEQFNQRLDKLLKQF